MDTICKTVAAWIRANQGPVTEAAIIYNDDAFSVQDLMGPQGTVARMFHDMPKTTMLLLANVDAATPTVGWVYRRPAGYVQYCGGLCCGLSVTLFPPSQTQK